MDRREAARLLGVGPLATPDEIRRAWRRAALLHHPDQAASPEEKKQAHERFIALTLARDVLLGAAPGGVEGVRITWDDDEDEEEEEVEEEQEDEEDEDEREEDAEDGEGDFAEGGGWPWAAGLRSLRASLASLRTFAPQFEQLAAALAAATARHADLAHADALDLLAFWAEVGPHLVRLQELTQGLADDGLLEAAERTRSLLLRAARAKRIVPRVTFVDARHCRVPSDSRRGHWYHVDVVEVECDCPDFTAGGHVCKHVLAALLRLAEERGRAIGL
ncbi:MAG: DnaJ domain-containing protein [Firmicutes bacterium]|nr:DnaJ domain-containing protein [Bacillota bacterium]